MLTQNIGSMASSLPVSELGADLEQMLVQPM